MRGRDLGWDTPLYPSAPAISSLQTLALAHPLAVRGALPCQCCASAGEASQYEHGENQDRTTAAFLGGRDGGSILKENRIQVCARKNTESNTFSIMSWL